MVLTMNPSTDSRTAASSCVGYIFVMRVLNAASLLIDMYLYAYRKGEDQRVVLTVSTQFWGWVNRTAGNIVVGSAQMNPEAPQKNWRSKSGGG